MLSEKVEEALNEQLRWEFFSAYLYLGMASYFQALGLGGFAHWMKVQAMEELTHASKFFSFLNERGGRARLGALEAPPWDWDSPLAAFQDALKHEQNVTARINSLVDLAREQHDHATEIFLQWFVTEQVEEESSATEVIQKLKLAGEHPASLYQLDRELGTRIFTMPSMGSASTQEVRA
ncbi:MAG: ferritin [bacterium]